MTCFSNYNVHLFFRSKLKMTARDYREKCLEQPQSTLPAFAFNAQRDSQAAQTVMMLNELRTTASESRD